MLLPGHASSPSRAYTPRQFRRPHSTYQKVVQGKCPLHFLHFNGVVCSNTLFSNTSALTNSLLFRANSTRKILEHLVWSNTSGLLLEQTFCRHFAARPTMKLLGMQAKVSLTCHWFPIRVPKAFLIVWFPLLVLGSCLSKSQDFPANQ